MTKKERVIAAINGQNVDGIPSGFSLHFPREIAFGENAVKAHLDFFRDTDTDILKIMNENLVPYAGEIDTPADYAKVKSFSIKDSFMQDQVHLTERILDGCDHDAFIMGTLHGVTASAIHPMEHMKKQDFDYNGVRAYLTELMRNDFQPVLDGMKRITDGMCELAGKYVEMGVDGVYYAALGGERRFFTDEEFAEWIEPLDKKILTAIKEAGGYCFLHICKDDLNMDRYKNYGKYCDVVNWGVYEAPYSLEQGHAMFPGKAIMGGLPNRHGVLVDGSIDDVQKAVREVIARNGRSKFILGADCTLATEQDLSRIRAAVEAARNA